MLCLLNIHNPKALWTTTPEVLLLLEQKKLGTHVVVVFWVVTSGKRPYVLLLKVQPGRMCPAPLRFEQLVREHFEVRISNGSGIGAPRLEISRAELTTANLRTKILDFRGFDSSII